MINRSISSELIRISNVFKAVCLTGPRQSGKTTLVKRVFASKPYVSFENPDSRNFAQTDPRAFIEKYKDGAVFDEVQRIPDIFSYLQEVIDNSRNKGQFILTGSNNFLLQQSINQSLSGRIGSLILLPFSINELTIGKVIPDNDDNLLFNGFYPPVYDQNISPTDWYPNYIRTYIERDVRQIKNISDLIVFERFLLLLAGRCGQELNLTSLSNEVGVDVKTIQSWIGILESSYIVFLLKAYYKNFNKTIVKRPKLYFYDTGLACSLLGIKNTLHVQTHPIRGSLFENMVIAECVKYLSNTGNNFNIYYWRDKTGREIDLIVENAGRVIPIEIKSSKTITDTFFKNLAYWKNITGIDKSVLLYAGEEEQKRSNGTFIMNWKKMNQLFEMNS